jgi:hypothetical protein
MGERRVMTNHDAVRILVPAMRSAEAMLARARTGAHNESQALRAADGEIAEHAIERRQRMDLLDAYVASIDRDSQDALETLLMAWLALYFNRTPRADLWQELAERVDREGGPTTYAFIMKMYGDIYRSERRRWSERERLGLDLAAHAPGDGTLRGIATVVDHSVLTHPGDERRLFDRRGLRINAGPSTAAGEWLTAEMIETFAKEGDLPSALFVCVTERLARMYCASQIFRYVCGPRRLVLIWTGSEGSDGSVRASARRSLAYPGQEAFIVRPPQRDAPPPDAAAPSASDDEQPLPICVLNSRGGMMRDWWHAASSPYSKRTSTTLHRELWERIDGRVALLRQEQRDVLWTASSAAGT